MSDKCPNCGFEVTLSPRERRSLTAEIQQKEAKRRALWDALVSAYKREGCGLGEAQILADVVMDSASDKQATDPKRDPLGEFDRRERSGSSVSDRQPAATKQRYCCDINATYPGKHRSGCPAESGQ